MNRIRAATLWFALGVLPLWLGQGAEPPPPPQTVISSDRLEMENDGQKAFFLFSDNVKLTGNNLIVTCDRLEVHSHRTGDFDANIGKLGSIQQILAIGNVSISQEGRTARAGRAEVLPAEDKIILTENPIVSDTQGKVSGGTITFYRGDRRAVVESGSTGPARVILPAMPNLGFNNDLKEPDAPEAGEPDPHSDSAETLPSSSDSSLTAEPS
jgi:lipopolysaccharide export system protein LptA